MALTEARRHGEGNENETGNVIMENAVQLHNKDTGRNLWNESLEIELRASATP